VLGAHRGGEDVAEHRLGQYASFLLGDCGGEPGLGEGELLRGYQNETHEIFYIAP
jgi:hypothetical protein